MGLEINISEKEPGIYLVVPKGEINTQTHQVFTERLKDTVAKAKAIVLEMGQVSYVSSMGLSALFRVKLGIEAHVGTIALVNTQPQVQLVFDTMKVLSPQMFASLEEADEYLDKFLDGIQKGTIKPRLPTE